MRRVDHPRSFGNLIQLVDKDRALLRQIGHNIAVMDDLLADVDRGAKGIERNLHDIDGPHNAGAEAARLEKENPLSFRFAAVPVFRDVLEGGCSHVLQYTASTPSLELG
jgi:hypothetical protein